MLIRPPGKVNFSALLNKLNIKFDFVYIDGDHSEEQVYKDAVNMFSKMKNNSIILFDDYLFNVNGVITQHGIDKFLQEYNGKYELLFKDYQAAIKVKKV